MMGVFGMLAVALIVFALRQVSTDEQWVLPEKFIRVSFWGLNCGLAMMVEILCSVLSGGAMANEVGGIRFRGKTVRVSQMYMAIDVARFMPVPEFTERVEQLGHLMKSTPAAPGYDEVMVAGDPEWRMEAERRANGIPIAAGNWDALSKAAARVGVPVLPLE
jgi:LDH2 family malate/lactate/ureidoglycolate dehydrogenase